MVKALGFTGSGVLSPDSLVQSFTTRATLNKIPAQNSGFCQKAVLVLYQSRTKPVYSVSHRESHSLSCHEGLRFGVHSLGFKAFRCCNGFRSTS